MEITQSIQTPSTLIASNARPASDFGMSNGGQSCFGILTEARPSWIPATGLMASSALMTTEGADLRDRKDLAAKGHVAVAAYVPGYPAWSPPIC